MGKIKVGVVGAGEMGIIHGLAYLKLKETEIVGVFDIDEEKGQNLAQQVNTRCFSSYQELLESGIDAVSICTPHNFHYKHAILAANAGKHILLEKPMTTNVDLADKILRACRENNVKLMIGMTHRFYPEMIEAKRLVSKGAIGKLYMATDTIVFPTDLFMPWMFNKESGGGGIFLINGIHSIDRLRWIIGSEVKEVVAQVGTFTMNTDTEDNGIAFLKFENNVFATMVQSCSSGNVFKCDLELYGSEGIIQVESWQKLSLTNRRQTYTKFFWPKRAGLFDKVTLGIEHEIQEFINSIIENREPCITGENGREDLRVILSIYESSTRGEKVLL